jgi:hypothetical protein
MVALGGVKDHRAGSGFRVGTHLLGLLAPSGLAEWLTMVGVGTLAAGAGLAAAAAATSRRLSISE